MLVCSLFAVVKKIMTKSNWGRTEFIWLHVLMGARTEESQAGQEAEQRPWRKAAYGLHLLACAACFLTPRRDPLRSNGTAHSELLSIIGSSHIDHQSRKYSTGLCAGQSDGRVSLGGSVFSSDWSLC